MIITYFDRSMYMYVCAIVFVSAYLYSCLRISQGLLTVEAPVAGSLLSSLVKWDRWLGKAKPKAFVCINTERKICRNTKIKWHKIQKSYDTKHTIVPTAKKCDHWLRRENQKPWSAQTHKQETSWGIYILQSHWSTSTAISKWYL